MHGFSSVETVVAADRSVDLIPIVLDASCLESTTPSHPRDPKAGLAGGGYLSAELAVETRFSDDAPLMVQSESDHLREYARAAAFLDVGHVAVDVTECCRPDGAESALVALGEHARHEGVAFELRGSIDGR